LPLQPIRLRSFDIHALQKLREQRKAYERQLKLDEMMVEHKLKTKDEEMLKEVTGPDSNQRTIPNFIGVKSKSFWNDFHTNRFF
jgi:hypothetical protein